jgi:protocatechuate 3,4-dioxygenase beta subunit
LTGHNGDGVAVTDHATTAGNGAYLFTEDPGTYTVTVDASNFTGTGALATYNASPTLVGTDRTVDSNNNPSATSPATLAGGGSDPTVDFGYHQNVTIGNFVWDDTNLNGIQNNGEPGINGVTLTLTGTTGAGATITDHATTAGNGAYLFTEAPGTYTVTVDASNFTGTGALVGFAASPTLVGTDRTVDSNTNPSATSPATLAGGSSDPTVDFGYHQDVTIGNFVWNDVNDDGIQQNGEAGINGVTLTLTGTDAGGNQVTDHATTAGNGAYLFTEAAGTYTVTVDASNFTGTGALATYSASPTLVGTDRTVDSNTNPSATNPTTLPQGGSDLTVDFGYHQPVTIGNFVWDDANDDGIQDNGEAGINGVTLTLTGTDGAGNAVTDHATTAGNGAYLFTEAPGTYTVTVDASNFTGTGALATYTASPTLVGTDRTVDSNTNPSATNPATLTGGGSDPTVDFGYHQDVTIGNFVWNDTNHDGIQENGEPGINGVTLTLTGTDGSGNPVTDHVTTSGNGGYLFSEAPGTYTVTVDASNFNPGGALAGFTPSPTLQGGDTTLDSNPNPSGTTPTTLSSGGSDTTVDFGYFQGLSIGDFVWNDANNNGRLDGGETGVNGVSVTLLMQQGGGGFTAVATTTTTGNGHYEFDGLAPGTYEVQITPPAGFVSSTGTNGGPGAFEPGSTDFSDAGNNTDHGTEDAGGTTITSQPITLAAPGNVGNPDTGPAGPNTANFNADLGIFQTLSIGDTVWNDANNDGMLDNGETGIAGVTVMLVDQNNNVVATTTTNMAGGYLFTDLSAGQYRVIIPPSNFRGVLANFTSSTGINGSASGPYEPPQTGHFDGFDGQDKGTTTGGMGMVEGGLITLSLGGENFTQAPPPGGLIDPAAVGNSDRTQDFGFFQPLTLGDYVWSDANDNGIFDAGEKPLVGVTVALLDGNGSPILGAGGVPITVTTDANGAYHFTDLTPGTYEVEVVPPTGYIAGPVTQAPGTNNANHGVEQLNGDSLAPPVTLGLPGDTNTNPDNNGLGNLRQDFGLFAPVTIGSTIWHDVNGNGLLDPGDPRIAGVTVDLYDTSGDLLGTAVTDANGQYLFTNSPNAVASTSVIKLPLAPDTQYVIKLDNPANYAPGGPLASLGLTLAFVGGDPNLNSKGIYLNAIPIAVVNTGDPGTTDLIFNFGFLASTDAGALSKRRYIN